MYDILLFDLDGTLSDPGVGITNSVMHALKHWNIEVSNRSELYRFIGPPLLESFQRFYGFSEEESREALEIYREYFSVKGLYENELYEGIEEMLKTMKKRKKTVILATSKPEPYAKQILEYFKIDRYFDFIAGASMDETRVAKADVIRYALRSAGFIQKGAEFLPVELRGKTVMIGDRSHDVEGARANQIQALGVLYGYGSGNEILHAGPNYIARTVEDITDIVG